MTLVFAQERSASAIHDPLRARRTVAYVQNILYGEEQYLRPLFDLSLEIKTPDLLSVFEVFKALEPAKVAAAEDARTPPNTYPC